MKKFTFLLISLFLISSFIYGQDNQIQDDPRIAITIGIFNGGGSLVGADLEVMLSKRLGIQAGAGFIGLGAGLNYHLKPSIRSSMISLQYWHQGFGESYTQSLMGPSFVFRAKKIFTAQLGFGFPLEQGPAWPEDKMEQPPIMLMYSIGIYLPIK